MLDDLSSYHDALKVNRFIWLRMALMIECYVVVNRRAKVMVCICYVLYTEIPNKQLASLEYANLLAAALAERDLIIQGPGILS